MSRQIMTLLDRLEIDPRGYVALVRAWILLDLRGQFYARATATKPKHVISPLFLVVGQCLTASAVASLVLFARVDAWFYAFVGLSLSMLVMATLVIVEFHEVVFDPNDLEILGARPVSPRTYAAARLTNLLFYVALMFVALNIFPAIVGAGLRDSGPWYLPAYLVASLAGNTVVVAAVIGLMSIGAVARPDGLAQGGTGLDPDRADPGRRIRRRVDVPRRPALVRGLGVVPPAWARFLPTAWLAGFVDRSADRPGPSELATASGLLVLTLAASLLTVARVGQMYRQMGPALASRRLRPMKPELVGGLDLAPPASWMDTEHRVGFWLGRRLLGREPNFTIRCLIPLNTAVAVMILGLATGQFANPLVERTPARVVLPILSVYLMVLAVPPIVYNLGFCRDSEASWVLRTAPLARPGRVGLGLCQGVLVWLLLPLCVLWCVVAGIAWRDPVSALLHGALAVSLAWPTALASLATVLDSPPLSRPPVRAGSSGPWSCRWRPSRRWRCWPSGFTTGWVDRRCSGPPRRPCRWSRRSGSRGRPRGGCNGSWRPLHDVFPLAIHRTGAGEVGPGPARPAGRDLRRRAGAGGRRPLPPLAVLRAVRSRNLCPVD